MWCFKSPIGWLGVQVDDGRLVDIEFIRAVTSTPQRPSTLEWNIEQQLTEYFRHNKTSFNLPLSPAGSVFQQRVWSALQDIPYGQVRTYGQIARALNSSPRAVGNACRANPIPVIIPCHRVVAARGIGGYAGKTDGPVLARKRWLLTHEGVAL
ncbi:MAG: methylated-DNA--[protein]-cysteine S-methyltransferase [Gammaproteobacteria bacterium]